MSMIIGARKFACYHLQDDFDMFCFLKSKKAIFIFFFLFFESCVKPPLPPPSTLQLDQIDTRPLKNKIIVIDPGHGGLESGAVGIKGLKESEVNLGVALYLWGLLHEAGARPILTRSADIHVSERADFSLQEELKSRSSLSNQQNADLFISIHHNSDVNDRKRNDLQIYYKLSDPGPSLDVAGEIFSALQDRLQIPKGDVYPGNYAVLRKTQAPAVLGETSFVTNKKNETKLAFHRTLLQEAEGYFYGILSYFQKGIPLVTELEPINTTLTCTNPVMKAKLQSGNPKETIQRSRILFKFDGDVKKNFSFLKDNTFFFKPKIPLKNGRHHFCLAYRNKLGNVSQEKCASFVIALRPCFINITSLFSVIPPDGLSTTPIIVNLFDCLKRPILDDSEVRLHSTAGRLISPHVTTYNGQARTILFSDKRAKGAIVTAEANGISASTTVLFDRPEKALFMATLKNPDGNPIRGVQLIHQGNRIALSDVHGYVYDKADLSGQRPYHFFKAGYHPLTYTAILSGGKSTNAELSLVPVDGGLFFKQKIMLNIDGPKREALPVILALKERIEKSGGSVILSHDNASPEEKVIRASQEKVSLFLTFEITEDTLSVEYYFRSLQGKTIAENICRGFKKNERINSGQCKHQSSIRFLIVHTEMPAVQISLPQEIRHSYEIVSSIVHQALLDLFLKRSQEKKGLP